MNSRRLPQVFSVVVLLFGVTGHGDAQSVEELVRDGVDAYQRGEYRSAIGYFEGALRMYPGLSAGTVSLLGSAYEQVGAIDSAIVVYERVIDRAFDRVHVDLIRLYLKRARPDDARRLIAIALERVSVNAAHLKSLAASLARAREINPREGDDSLFVLIYKGILGTGVGEASSYVDFARILLKRGDFPRVHSLLQSFHAAVPGDPRLDLLLGHAMFQIGKYDSAKTISARVLQSDPRSVEALLLCGQALTQEGLTTEAIGYFKKALAVDPGSADASIGIASVHIAQHDTIGAIDAWERALSINSALDQKEFVALCVAWGTRSLREGNLPSAISCFSKIDSVQLVRPEDELTISTAHYMNKNIRSAKDHATRALHGFGKQLEDHPADVPVHISVCECHIILGDLLSAESDIQRYLYRAGPGGTPLARGRLRKMVETGVNAEDVRLLVSKYFPPGEESDDRPGITEGGGGQPPVLSLSS